LAGDLRQDRETLERLRAENVRDRARLEAEVISARSEAAELHALADAEHAHALRERDEAHARAIAEHAKDLLSRDAVLGDARMRIDALVAEAARRQAELRALGEEHARAIADMEAEHARERETAAQKHAEKLRAQGEALEATEALLLERTRALTDAEQRVDDAVRTAAEREDAMTSLRDAQTAMDAARRVAEERARDLEATLAETRTALVLEREEKARITEHAVVELSRQAEGYAAELAAAAQARDGLRAELEAKEKESLAQIAERDETIETLRASERTLARALDDQTAALVSELEAAREALVAERTLRGTEASATQRAHAELLATTSREREELERHVAVQESALREMTRARADAEERAAGMDLALENARADATATADRLAALASEHAVLETTLTELKSELAAAAARYEDALRAAHEREEETSSRILLAERSRDEARATLEARLAGVQAERARERDDLAREIARITRERDAALEHARAEADRAATEAAQAYADALERAQADAAATTAAAVAAAEGALERRIAELSVELDGARQAVDALRTESALAHEKGRAQTKLEARIAELERLVARGRETLDLERRDRLREEGETMMQIDELEERVTSANAQIGALTSELAHLREEVPALEGEIGALRAELSIVRTKLESESALARVANEQVERNRKLLDRAKETLAALVGDDEEQAG
jgi:hypothetical protein